MDKARDYIKEKKAAVEKRAQRLGDLILQRNEGTLGDDAIKLAHVLLLCTLPSRPTQDRQITRAAQLGPTSILRVTFTAMDSKTELPFGSDRRLLAWLLDRAIKSESPFVEWESSWEYQREVGLGHSGRSNQQVRESFRRLSGLGIFIPRNSIWTIGSEAFSLFRSTRLPRSIQPEDPSRQHFEADSNMLTMNLPADKYGVLIDPLFHQSIQTSGHHVAVPRDLWKIKGNSKIHDMTLWFYYRCYSARSESVIPWRSLDDQFGVAHRPKDQRLYAREAIFALQSLWPGCSIAATDCGILIGPKTASLLPDDPSRRRLQVV